MLEMSPSGSKNHVIPYSKNIWSNWKNITYKNPACRNDQWIY